MASFFVGTAAETAIGYAVHDRSRCPPACLGAAHAVEYLGEYGDEAQALTVARLRYGGICHCRRRDTAAWVWPAPEATAIIPPRL